MKIKITKSCFGKGFSYSVGDTAEVSESLGKDLICCGFAEEIKSKKDTKTAKTNTDVNKEDSHADS